MEYVEISNTENRIIKFGLSKVERYKIRKMRMMIRAGMYMLLLKAWN